MIQDFKTKRLDSFLFCFSLESGGYFLGWMGDSQGVVGSLLVILTSILAIVAVAQGMMDDDTLRQMGFASDTSDTDVVRTGETRGNNKRIRK